MRTTLEVDDLTGEKEYELSLETMEMEGNKCF